MNRTIFSIARRYLVSQTTRQAVHILSMITIIAMAAGAAALIIILSTFNGFESISKNLSESFQADLTILPKHKKHFTLSEIEMDKIQSLDGVKFISRVLEDKIYIRYHDKELIAMLRGVDSNYFSTNQLHEYILVGDTQLRQGDYSFGIVGAGIASALDIDFNNQFESMSVYFPKTENTTNLESPYELSYLIPGGTFSIFQDYDEKYVIAPLDFAQYMFQSEPNQYTSIEIKINLGDEKKIRESIQTIVGDEVMLKNKSEMNDTFVKISKIERLIVYIILTFILIILSFNFIGSLTMHTIDKENDFKTMHSFGLNSEHIRNLILIIGTAQGLIGGIIGLIVGCTVCMIQKYFEVIPMPGNGSFVITAYPVQVEIFDIVTIIAIVLSVSFIASLLPATRISHRIESIRRAKG